MPRAGHERGEADEADRRRPARDRPVRDADERRQRERRTDDQTADERRREKRTSEEHKAQPSAERPVRDRDERRSRPPRRSTINARTAAQHAAVHVRDLTGRIPEGVTSIDRTDTGWRVGIEVLEEHRIPDSTDILATYRVDVDEDGELVSYHRDQRYYRGRANEE